jgi:hypothetical protein
MFPRVRPGNRPRGWKAVAMSLSDWMFDADYEWRQRLQSVNLAIETDFTEDEIREAQCKFGAASTELRKRGLSPQEIVKKYPGLALTILVGHASLAYDHGAYWDSFWQELGLARDQDFEQAIRTMLWGGCTSSGRTTRRTK